MTRPGEVVSLLLLCSLSSCASCEGIEGSNELKGEAADLRNIGIRAELAAAKATGQKSDDKPTTPNLPDDCDEITKEIAFAGGACAIELVLAEKDGKECTESTCPECVRLRSLREKSKKKGC